MDDTTDHCHCGRVDAEIIGFTCRENNIQCLPHVGKTLRPIKKIFMIFSIWRIFSNKTKNIKTANKRIDHLNPLKLRNTVN